MTQEELSIKREELKDMRRRERSLVFRLRLQDQTLTELQQTIIQNQIGKIHLPNKSQEIKEVGSDLTINKELSNMKQMINEKNNKISELEEQLKTTELSQMTGQKIIEKLKRIEKENEELSRQNNEEVNQNFKIENSLLRQKANEILFQIHNVDQSNQVILNEIKLTEPIFDAIKKSIKEAKEKNLTLQKEFEMLKLKKKESKQPFRIDMLYNKNTKENLVNIIYK